MDASFPLPGRHDEYLDWAASGAGRFHWPFTEVELCLIEAWEEWAASAKEGQQASLGEERCVELQGCLEGYVPSLVAHEVQSECRHVADLRVLERETGCQTTLQSG